MRQHEASSLPQQDSPVFLAFVTCGLPSNSIKTIYGEEGYQGPSERYYPAILDKAPEKAKRQLPEEFALCCMPAGVRIALKQDMEVEDMANCSKLYPVVLTDVRSNHLYVSCLSYYEELPSSITCKHPETVGGRASRILCLVSSLPYLKTMESILRRLYSSIFERGTTLPVADAVANLMSVPCPGLEGLEGTAQVWFDVVGHRMHLLPPSPPHGLPTHELEFRLLTNLLSPDNLMLVFLAVLLEKKVVLRSHSHSNLTLACEALIQLIYPLKHVITYIPVCPTLTGDGFLESPFSFLIGMLSSVEVNPPDYDHILLADLDDDYVSFSNDEIRDVLHHYLSAQPIRQLSHHLSVLLGGSSSAPPVTPPPSHPPAAAPTPGFNTASSLKSGPLVNEWDAAPHMTQQQQREQVDLTHIAKSLYDEGWSYKSEQFFRRICLECMSDLLQGYDQCVIRRDVAASGSSVPASPFAFLGAQPPGTASRGVSELAAIDEGREAVHQEAGGTASRSVSKLKGEGMSSRRSMGVEFSFEDKAFSLKHTDKATSDLRLELATTMHFQGFLEQHQASADSPYAWLDKGIQAFTAVPAHLHQMRLPHLHSTTSSAWPLAGPTGGSIGMSAQITGASESGPAAGLLAGLPEEVPASVVVVPPCAPSLLQPWKGVPFKTMPPLYLTERGLLKGLSASQALAAAGQSDRYAQQLSDQTQGLHGEEGFDGEEQEEAGMSSGRQPEDGLTFMPGLPPIKLRRTHSQTLDSLMLDGLEGGRSARGEEEPPATTPTTPTLPTPGAARLSSKSSLDSSLLSSAFQATVTVGSMDVHTTAPVPPAKQAAEKSLVATMSSMFARLTSSRASPVDSKKSRAAAAAAGAVHQAAPPPDEQMMVIPEPIAHPEMNLITEQTAALKALFAPPPALTPAPLTQTNLAALASAPPAGPSLSVTVGPALTRHLGQSPWYLIRRLQDELGISNRTSKVSKVDNRLHRVGSGRRLVPTRPGAVTGRLIDIERLNVVVDMLSSLIDVLVRKRDWRAVGAVLQVAAHVTRETGLPTKERGLHRLGERQPLLASAHLWVCLLRALCIDATSTTSGITFHGAAVTSTHPFPNNSLQPPSNGTNTPLEPDFDLPHDSQTAVSNGSVQGVQGDQEEQQAVGIPLEALAALEAAATWMMDLGLQEETSWQLLSHTAAWYALHVHLRAQRQALESSGAVGLAQQPVLPPSAAHAALVGLQLQGLRSLLRSAACAARGVWEARRPVMYTSLVPWTAPSASPPLTGLTSPPAAAPSPPGAATSSASAAHDTNRPANSKTYVELYQGQRSGRSISPNGAPAAGPGVSPRPGSAAAGSSGRLAQRPPWQDLSSTGPRPAARGGLVRGGGGKVTRVPKPSPDNNHAVPSVPGQEQMDQTPRGRTSHALRRGGDGTLRNQPAGAAGGPSSSSTAATPPPRPGSMTTRPGAITITSPSLESPDSVDYVRVSESGYDDAPRLLGSSRTPGAALQQSPVKRRLHLTPCDPRGSGLGTAHVIADVTDGSPITGLAAVPGICLVSSQQGALHVLRFGPDGDDVTATCVALPGMPGGCGVMALHAAGGVVRCAAGGLKEHRLALVDVNTRKTSLLSDQGLRSHISQLTWSTSGCWLVAASLDGGARVWDTRAPADAAMLNITTGHAQGISALLMDELTNQLVTGGMEGTIRLWDLRKTTSHTSLLTGHTGRVTSLLTIPAPPAGTRTGELLVSASDDWTLRLWEVDQKLYTGHDLYRSHVFRGATCTVPLEGRTTKFPCEGGECRGVLVAHGGPVSKVCQLRDSSLGQPVRLVSAAGDGSVATWDVAAALSTPGEGCESLTHLHNGSVLLLECLHTSNSGHLVKQPSGEEDSVAQAPAPVFRQGMVISGSDDGGVCAWYPATSAPGTHHNSGAQHLAVSSGSGTVSKRLLERDKGQTMNRRLSLTLSEQGLGQGRQAAQQQQHRPALGPVQVEGHCSTGLRAEAICSAADSSTCCVYSGGPDGVVHVWRLNT